MDGVNRLFDSMGGLPWGSLFLLVVVITYYLIVRTVKEIFTSINRRLDEILRDLSQVESLLKDERNLTNEMKRELSQAIRENHDTG